MGGWSGGRWGVVVCWLASVLDLRAETVGSKLVRLTSVMLMLSDEHMSGRHCVLTNAMLYYNGEVTEKGDHF